MVRIGLISDTHGLLRPEAEAFLLGSDFIVHAGDICDGSILEALETIAPVTAVRGNNDHGAWAQNLNETEFLQVGEFFLYAIRIGLWSRSAAVCYSSILVAPGRVALRCLSPWAKSSSVVHRCLQERLICFQAEAS